MLMNIICIGVEKDIIDYAFNELHYNCSIQHILDYELEKEKIEQIIEEKIGVVILIDINKYEEIAYQLASENCGKQKVFVVFCSDKCTPENRVKWLSLGADDYIMYPFYISEVTYKMSKNMERLKSNYIIVDDFRINLPKQKVIYKGTQLKLTKKEYALLSLLVKSKGQVLTREKLLTEINGSNQYLTSRSIDTLIKQLRKKIDSNMIITIRNTGYCYIGINQDK